MGIGNGEGGETQSFPQGKKGLLGKKGKKGLLGKGMGKKGSSAYKGIGKEVGFAEKEGEEQAFEDEDFLKEKTNSERTSSAKKTASPLNRKKRLEELRKKREEAGNKLRQLVSAQQKEVEIDLSNDDFIHHHVGENPFHEKGGEPPQGEEMLSVEEEIEAMQKMLKGKGQRGGKGGKGGKGESKGLGGKLSQEEEQREPCRRRSSSRPGNEVHEFEWDENCAARVSGEGKGGEKLFLDNIRKFQYYNIIRFFKINFLFFAHSNY